MEFLILGAIFQKRTIWRNVMYIHRCLKDVDEHPKIKINLFHKITIKIALKCHFHRRYINININILISKC